MKHLKIKDIIVNTSPEKVPIGTIPYIEIGDIDIFNKTYQYKDKKSVSGAKYALKDSIIVSTVRPTRGAISVIKEEKIAVSNAFAIINVDKEQCNYKYLFYMINSNKFYEYLGSNSKGATYPTCSREDVYNYEIVLPSLENQNKIVKIFDNISNNINIKKQQILSLEQLVKSQFIEMFGDPIKNEMCWNKKELKELVTDDCKISYGIVQTGEEVSDGIPVFRPVDIVNNNPKLEELKKTTKSISDKYKKTILKGDELLITVRANIGDTFIVDETFKGCNVGRGITPIRFDSKNINTIFAKAFFDNESTLNEVKSKTKGITLVQLNMEDLRKLQVIMPPIELQNKFANIVKQIDKQVYEFEKQLEKLKKLQESLMKEYFG